jgi:hypothetical protein
VSESALPQVSDRGAAAVACRPSAGTVGGGLLSSRLHLTPSTRAAGIADKKVVYDLLFQTSAQALLQVAADPKPFGRRSRVPERLAHLGQNLLRHPHIHCVIPAGGLSPDHTRWIHPRYPFLVPVKVLSRVFRGKFVAGLKKCFCQGELIFAGSLQPLSDPKAFASFLRTLFPQDWVVYAKPPFGGPERVLRYLARYTRHVAISNHRLLAFENNQVTFRWKDYTHGNKKRKMTLSSEEFLRRFLLHVLPRGFVRIRFFGFLPPRRRTKLLPLCPQPARRSSQTVRPRQGHRIH